MLTESHKKRCVWYKI